MDFLSCSFSIYIILSQHTMDEKVTSNEQKVRNNEPKVTSNQNEVWSNEQKVQPLIGASDGVVRAGNGIKKRKDF